MVSKWAALPTAHYPLSTTSLGFSRLRALHVSDRHLYLAGLDLFLLRQRHAQHAVFELGVHSVDVDRRRQAERAGEAAVATLDPTPVVPFLLLLELALPAQGEPVIFNRKIEIPRLKPGQVGFERDRVLILVYVHVRRP